MVVVVVVVVAAAAAAGMLRATTEISLVRDCVWHGRYCDPRARAHSPRKRHTHVKVVATR